MKVCFALAMKRKLAVLTVAVAACLAPLQAQTLVDTWSYDGGGLSPTTYSGSFKPAVLVPDASANSGATISVSGMTSGGLGSSGFPEGYGGIYTLFSSEVNFGMTTSNVLSSVGRITFSFLAGGGTTYDAGDLLLNFNAGNPALESISFTPQSAGLVSTPIGDVEVTLYTWTWDVSGLGLSNGFSVNWSALQHTFINDITLTQAVPEPTVAGLMALGAGCLLLRRRGRNGAGV